MVSPEAKEPNSGLKNRPFPVQAVKFRLLSLRDLLISAGPFIVLAAVLLALAYWWLDPQPPRRIRLATGPEQSAYARFGQRYADLLAQDGIRVELVASEGSQANLQLLREGRAELGFVQGGTDLLSRREASAEDLALISLGSLFVEPVWVFYRVGALERARVAGASAPAPAAKAAQAVAATALAATNTATTSLTSLKELAGLRVNIGTPGSGVPSLMRRLWEINRVEIAGLRLSHEEQTPATVSFLNGEIDALVFVSSPEAPMVQMLLQTPDVGLMDFPQAEAYARRLPFVTAVTLPRGVVDLAADLPPRNVRLIASTTSLLAREELHPALAQLFAQAAQKLHGGAGWFNRAREFPTVEHAEYPIAKDAERTYKSGAPLLQRYLPFWLANLVERMWLALGLIVAVLLPLSRIVPPLYELRVRSRVFRWYGKLREIEARVAQGTAAPGEIQAELDQLERQVQGVNVPLSYADEVYALRNYVRMIRERLAA